MNDKLRISLENIRPLTEVRDHFSRVVSEVQKNKLYILTKGGKPAIALVDVKYLEELTSGAIKKVELEREVAKVPAEQIGRTKMVDHELKLPELDLPTPEWQKNPPPENKPVEEKPAPVIAAEEVIAEPVKSEEVSVDKPAANASESPTKPTQPAIEPEIKPLTEPQFEPAKPDLPPPPPPETPPPPKPEIAPPKPAPAPPKSEDFDLPKPVTPKPDLPEAPKIEKPDLPEPVNPKPDLPPPAANLSSTSAKDSEEVDIQFSPDATKNQPKANNDTIDEMALD